MEDTETFVLEFSEERGEAERPLLKADWRAAVRAAGKEPVGEPELQQEAPGGKWKMSGLVRPAGSAS